MYIHGPCSFWHQLRWLQGEEKKQSQMMKPSMYKPCLFKQATSGYLKFFEMAWPNLKKVCKTTENRFVLKKRLVSSSFTIIPKSLLFFQWEFSKSNHSGVVRDGTVTLSGGIFPHSRRSSALQPTYKWGAVYRDRIYNPLTLIFLGHRSGM